MAMGAGWMTLTGLEARRQEGQSMHSALQMNAMQTVERMEYNVLSEEVEYAHAELSRLRQQAEGFVNKVHWEQEHSKKEAIRAQFFQNAADNDQEKADSLTMKVNATDQERLALLQTLHEEEQTEKALLQQLRDSDFHTGLCETRGFFHFCELIGGLTKLQKEADETDLQIHRDMERLAVIYHQEYLQVIATQAFQHKADKYQNVADDLVHTASLWSAQAEIDQSNADTLVQEADSVEKQAESLEKRSRSYQDSIVEMTDAVKQMLDDAHQHEKASITAFCISLVLLVLPLVVFTYRCVVGFIDVFDQAITWSMRNRQNAKELCRGVSYFVLHTLFFLAATTACREYLGNLDKYSTEKRAVVIVYVAFVGALAQSF